MPRTFGNLPFMKMPKYDAKPRLFRILRAYANHDKSLGYTQGMNIIAAVILMTMSNYGSKLFMLEEEDYLDLAEAEHNPEVNTFFILNYIMQDMNWRKVLEDGTPKLLELLVLFENIIEKRFPKLQSFF